MVTVLASFLGRAIFFLFFLAVTGHHAWVACNKYLLFISVIKTAEFLFFGHQESHLMLGRLHRLYHGQSIPGCLSFSGSFFKKFLI